MPSDLARALTAVVELDRAARDATANRQRLRRASEQLAVALLARLRVGDEARLGNGVLYRVEQITWPIADTDDASEPEVDPRGARALLRGAHVLVAGTRKHGSIRVHELGHRLARLHADRHEPAAWDVRPASDDARIAFAGEQADVIEAFAFARRTDSESLDQAAMRLLTGLADFLATPD